MGWADIAHGGKSLQIAFGDIGALMFEGLREGENFLGPTRNK